MAENVRFRMAQKSGIPLHTLGARELRKEMKEKAEKEKAKRAAMSGKTKSGVALI